MKKAEPIKNEQQLERFKNFYLEEEYNPRNYVFVTMGLNTALRVSDMLGFCWEDVYDFKNERFKSHLIIVEQKTQKLSVIYLNIRIVSTLEWYKQKLENDIEPDTCLFPNSYGYNISRVQAYRIVRHAAQKCDIEGVISPHSLRKTFGYQAFRQGTSPVLLMEIYQHSSFNITKRYLGIEQDERDSVFRDVVI